MSFFPGGFQFVIWIELYCVCVVISIVSIEKCSKNYNLGKRKKDTSLLRFLIFTTMFVLIMLVFILSLHVCFLLKYNVLWLLLLLDS
jgi:ABC-type Co2+ transport system permease subunit